MVWSTERTVLAGVTLAFFATMVARLVISPVVPLIADEFSVSNAAIGLALTGMWFAYASAQFPSGLFGDRIGERAVILIAVGGTAVASGLLALSPVFAVFVVFAFALGGVAGLHYSVATTLLSRRFEDIGTAIGIHSAGAPVAGLLAPVAAAYVGTRISWRVAVALGTLTAVPSFLLFARAVDATEPTRPGQRIRDRIDPAALAELLSRPPIAGAMVVSVLMAFVWQGTASFLPTFLVEHRSYSETTAGVVFSGYFVIQGVGQPGMGWLSDRFGRVPATAGAALTGVGGYVLYVTGPGLASVAVATVLVGVAMSWGAAMLPLFLDHMTAEEEGMGFGLVRTTYMVLGATGSVGVGLLADVWDWRVSFLVLAGLQALVVCGLVGAMVLGRTGGR
jgi:YNFM family putative membrane transporter